MPVDPTIRDHKTWIGYLQPDGLVVSPAALVDAQVAIDRSHLATRQQEFLSFVGQIPHGDDNAPAVTDLKRLLGDFLGWPGDLLYGASPERPIPDALKIPLRDFGETLEPTFALRHARPDDPDRAWLMLVDVLPPATDLDRPVESKLAGWSASPTRRFERLLRETEVPIGLIANGTHLRLIYAPRGENAGTLTFPVAAMTEIAGRPILAAFDMLLSRYRLLAAPSEARLPALLKRSRDYQSRVSTALAQQVLDALYELLRGFQAADDHAHGELLKKVLADDPDQVYAGLLTVLMRLVFLLYAEDQGLMPGGDLYVRNYAVHGLFERLRSDAEHYPDTMEHRYGAWAQLDALFRAVHRGCNHALFRMPAREGHLFDPDRYPFLMGYVCRERPPWRSAAPESTSPLDSRIATEGAPYRILPLVPDGTIYRVLEKLLILDGERLSYRTLDVEQIGSVYETMMGFRLDRAAGTSIALKPAKPHGAPVPISLEELLAARPADRAKLIAERTDYKLPAAMANTVRSAASIDDLLAALERRVARNATPQPVGRGTMLLIPTDERRKSGSHYTPRSLTEPIVRTTLKPIFEHLAGLSEDGLPRPSPSNEPLLDGLGRPSSVTPTPDQILSLKICDPAMGSGAFLVEACRQLADALVAAWAAHGYKPYIPPDEDEVLHARRLIAQRCLYGVDRNPMAVDLAKLSLWLATLAKDHPFTFLDHSFRAGDSLVGLTRSQIVGFDLEPSAQLGFVEAKVRERMERAALARRTILEAGDDLPPAAKQQKLALADEQLDLVRLAGDALVASFFAGDKPRARKQLRDDYFNLLDRWLARADGEARLRLSAIVRALRGENSLSLRTRERVPGAGVRAAGAAVDSPSPPPLTPFHWEIEFPEVFARETSGFDCIVGNPPFAGKNTLINSNREGYLDWLKAIHDESHGNADLVAHFFRRAFNLLRPDGCFGLIATNTIGQGDTRSTGLRWICTHGGTIYAARKRYKWPGLAAVVVSVVHVCKGQPQPPYLLDGRQVAIITAYLFHDGGHNDPEKLQTNEGKSFQGSIVLGMGFTFDDTATDGVANAIAEIQRLIEKDPRNAERIFPYIGGEDINESPTQSHHRYVINFGELSEADARRWPDLVAIVEMKVKPERLAQNDRGGREKWWQFLRPRAEMLAALAQCNTALVASLVTKHLSFAFVSTDFVFSHKLVVIPSESTADFAALQCRAHESWARFFASTLEDRLNYSPSDCFETFAFPNGHEKNASLERAGREYCEFRAALMVRNNEGLTKTYNRFHDPGEASADIVRLRELHDALDRAVLDAYSWTDIRPTCQFLLDYDDEDDADDESPARARTRRKPWRYRWPDDVRDEVLARLLKLNADRAEQERRTGAAAASAKPASRTAKRAAKNQKKPTPSDRDAQI
jgi:hypothetical protein